MNYKDEILSGITVSLALIPEAIAFSIIAHINPLIGIYSCIIIGLITALFGGRAGMISGATGAVAIVSVDLVLTHGQEYLFAAVILAGILQILFGLFKLSKLINKVPQSVISGFVNGLGIVIFTAQLTHLQKDGKLLEMATLLPMIGFIALTVLLIWAIPKVSKKVPAALISITLVSLLIVSLGIHTKTIGDIASISGTLPSLGLPDIKFDFNTLWTILPYSFMIAIVGLTESLLTLKLISKTLKKPAKPNKESLAQGFANTTSGLFGCMGGCAFVGQSIMNTSNGGVHRLSSITSVIALAILVIFATGTVEKIPMAALIGLMFIIAAKTFDFDSIKGLKRKPIIDTSIMIVVTLITVIFHNLAAAVIVGVILNELSKYFTKIGIIRTCQRT